MSIGTSLRRGLTAVALGTMLGALLAGCDQGADPLPQQPAKPLPHGGEIAEQTRARPTVEGVRVVGSARGNGVAKNAGAELLAACVSRTRHELDASPGNDYFGLDAIDDKAVAACRQAAQALPDSTVAQEHLGRALLALGVRPPGLTMTESAEVTVKAARAGALWAQAQLVLFGVAEFDRNALVQRLRAEVGARPADPGPRVLLAQVLMVVGGRVRPYIELHQPAVLLEAAVKMDAGPAMVSAMAHHLMRFGLCGRTVSPWLKVLEAPKPDSQGEEGCAMVLRIAASVDDPMAHLALGGLHLRNAHQAGLGRVTRAAATARFEESRQAAKRHFGRVAQSDSLLSGIGKQLLAKVDDVTMASSPSEDAGANLLLGLLGLVLSAPSSPGPASKSSAYEDAQAEQAERRRLECADARMRSAYMKPDGSAEDWSMRYRAANCP